MKESRNDEIGKRVLHDFKGLKMEMEITNVKRVFGTWRWCVRPTGQSYTKPIWIWAHKKPKFI